MVSSLRAEWPTWVALFGCYGGFVALTQAAPATPALYAVLPVLLAFHSSLQHEAIHGHPTPWSLVNEALLSPPIGLAFPYRRYRDTHLSHHQDARLTDPYDDPESWYLDPADWARRSAAMKTLLIVNNCALGRMALGPAIGVVRFVAADLALIGRGRRDVILAWALHGAAAAPVILWLRHVGVSPVAFGLACYGGLSLISLRGFLEHRADERVAGRSAIVEDRGPLAMLYLNNNLHAVHHADPGLPWWRLPARYRAHKARFLALNGGYVFSSYWEVLARHGVRPKEPPAHPLLLDSAGDGSRTSRSSNEGGPRQA